MADLHELFHPAKHGEQTTASTTSAEVAPDTPVQDENSQRRKSPKLLASNRLRLMTLLSGRFESRVTKWLDCENKQCQPNALTHVQVEIAPVSDESRFRDAVSLCGAELRVCWIDKVIVAAKSADKKSTYYVTSNETAPSESEMMIPLLVSDSSLSKSSSPIITRTGAMELLTGCIRPSMNNLLQAIARNKLRKKLDAELVFDEATTRAAMGESIESQINDLKHLSEDKERSSCQRRACEIFITILKDMTVTDKLPAKQIEDDAQRLLQNLPDSMYREEALNLLGSKSDTKVKLSNRTDEESQDLWGLAFTTLFFVALFPVSLVFLVILIKLLLAKTTSSSSENAAQESNEPPTVRYGWARVLVVFGWQIFSIILVILFELALGIDNQFESTISALRNPLQRGVFELVSNLIINSTVFVAYFKYCLPERISFQDAFALHWRTKQYTAKQLILLGVVGWLAMNSVTDVSLGLLAFFHYPETPTGAPAMLAKTISVGASFTIFVAEAIFGPFVEELCFRGVLYRSLRTIWGVGPSLIVSSLLFAVLHCELAPWLLFHKFAVGAINALMYEKTKSLTPAIVSHCLNNIFVAIV